MDRWTRASLDRWLTTPPDEDEPMGEMLEATDDVLCPDCGGELDAEGHSAECTRREAEYQQYVRDVITEQ